MGHSNHQRHWCLLWKWKEATECILFWPLHHLSVACSSKKTHEQNSISALPNFQSCHRRSFTTVDLAQWNVVYWHRWAHFFCPGGKLASNYCRIKSAITRSKQSKSPKSCGCVQWLELQSHGSTALCFIWAVQSKNMQICGLFYRMSFFWLGKLKKKVDVLMTLFLQAVLVNMTLSLELSGTGKCNIQGKLQMYLNELHTCMGFLLSFLSFLLAKHIS